MSNTQSKIRYEMFLGILWAMNTASVHLGWVDPAPWVGWVAIGFAAVSGLELVVRRFPQTAIR